MLSLSSFTSIHKELLLVITKQSIVKATANFLLKFDFAYSERCETKVLGQVSCWKLAACTRVSYWCSFCNRKVSYFIICGLFVKAELRLSG